MNAIKSVFSATTVADIRRILRLLQPDHACTGRTSITYHRDGSETHEHTPCPGCERQRERLLNRGL